MNASHVTVIKRRLRAAASRADAPRKDCSDRCFADKSLALHRSRPCGGCGHCKLSHDAQGCFWCKCTVAPHRHDFSDGDICNGCDVLRATQ